MAEPDAGQADGAVPQDARRGNGPTRYALPDRAALGAPQAQLFGPQSWQPPAPQRTVTPAVPRVPVMPYRYAGKVLHEGQLKIYLAKGDKVFAVHKGDTLDGAYRVQAIETSRITLLYLPLGRTQTIPVSSALPLATAPAEPARTPRAGAGGRAPRAVTERAVRRGAHSTAQAGRASSSAAHVLWDGPKRVKLGAQFSVALHVTSAEPVASSPMQFKFDPNLLETVAVKPGRFFDQGKDKFSYRVSPEGSIFIGASNRDHMPASDAEFLVLTFRSIKTAPVAELSIASLSLQGTAGRAIALDSPAAFRTAIAP